MARITIAGVYEDYCILILIAAFATYFFTLAASAFSSDFTILVSTNDYNEFWIEIIAFGIAIPGILVQAFKHFRVGGNTVMKRK